MGALYYVKEVGAQSFVKKNFSFPKKVGIVFLERRKRVTEVKSASKKKRGELSLDFDQNACAFFLLQLNQLQKIFEFQVIDIPVEKMISLRRRIVNLLCRMVGKSLKEENSESLIPKKRDKKDLLGWIDKFAQSRSDLSIDYWMGITSELIPRHKTWHIEAKMAELTKEHNLIWIITSKGWEKHRSPPSLFEYLLASVFRCALQCLSTELQNMEIAKMEFLRARGHKVTRGCIFDFTHRRISVSIFKLCSPCYEKLSLLEKLFWQNGVDIDLVADVSKVLSKEWMGTLEKRDSPLHDLKRIYKYDVDRNSGFKKGLREKFKDSVTDNLAPWTIGTVVTGLIGIILAIIFKQ